MGVLHYTGGINKYLCLAVDWQFAALRLRLQVAGLPANLQSGGISNTHWRQMKNGTLVVVAQVGWAEVVRLSRRLCNAPREEMREGLAYMACHTAPGGARLINGGWEYEKTLTHIIDDTRQCGEWVGLPEEAVHSLEWVSSGSGAHIFAIFQESGWLMVAISRRQSQYLNYVGGIRGAEFYTSADVVDEGEGSFSIGNDARWPMPYHEKLCDLLCQVVENFAASKCEETRAREVWEVVIAYHDPEKGWFGEEGEPTYVAVHPETNAQEVFVEWRKSHSEEGFWEEKFIHFLVKKSGGQKLSKVKNTKPNKRLVIHSYTWEWQGKNYIELI